MFRGRRRKRKYENEMEWYIGRAHGGKIARSLVTLFSGKNEKNSLLLLD